MWVDKWGHLPGQLVVVSGPSGSGKSTIINHTINHSNLNVKLSISATTRAPRPGEQHGVDYFFLGFDQFIEAKEKGAFLEYAEYNGNYYGTPAEPVFQMLASGYFVLLEIEVKGARQIRDLAPSSYFVFIKPPTFAALEKRLRARGTESEPVVFQRLRRAREELAESHWFDDQVINRDLNSAITEFSNLLVSYDRGG